MFLRRTPLRDLEALELSVLGTPYEDLCCTIDYPGFCRVFLGDYSMSWTLVLAPMLQ